MPSPGSARIVGTKMDLEINDPIADFRLRILDCFDFRICRFPSLDGLRRAQSSRRGIRGG
jgi:hypothetical protein